MVKQFLPAVLIVIFLSSCTALKPLNFSSNKPVAGSTEKNTQARFIEDISMTAQTGEKTRMRDETPMASNSTRRGYSYTETPDEKQETRTISELIANRGSSGVEAASKVQLKYAILLNTEVESLPSKALLENVDDWYGVRYRRGGVTKSGVDCSGFTFAVYMAVYGIALPRVSREQYRISRKISTTELQEGDLVFFNTTGSGVSHVGVYLGNSKFIHASVSKGVMVNSLFESYYLKRFIGGGRIDDKQIVSNTRP
jgi:cell wall-associated NlpC family hydrolase